VSNPSALLDTRTFARRTGTIAAGQVVVKSSQVVLTIVLVRLLAPAEWSQVAYLLSIYLVAVTLGTLNLQHGIVFFLPRVGPGRHRALLAQTAGLLAVPALLIAVGLIMTAPVLGGGRLDVALSLPLLAIAILLEVPTACAPAALVASDQLGLAAAWDIVVTVVQVGSVVVMAVVHQSAAGVVAGLAIAAAIRMALFCVLLATRFDGPFRGLMPGTLSAQIRYGVPLGLTIATSVLNRSIDKWFIAIFDPANVGVYAVAAQEVPLLAVLPYAGGAAVVTRIVDAFRRGDDGEARWFWLRQTSSMSAVVVPASALLILVAPELFVLVFTPDFAAGVLPFQLFTAITLHRVAEYGLVLRSAGRNGELVRSSLVLLGANVVLAGVGAAWFGMVGAAAGTLLANGLAWLFVLGRLGDVFGTTLGQSFAWWSWFVAVVCSAGAAFVASGAASLGSRSELGRVMVKVVAFGCTYVVLARCAGLRGSAPPAIVAADRTRAVEAIR
jgi:O-antigen/teichoic acid export membrane protein